jgi:sporulation protein YlmC with PRC-barrel domain
MYIHSADLLHLPVYTAAGQHLGRVTGFDIEITSHSVAAYYVRTGLIKGLWHHELVINRSQVISISAERMVVDDSATAVATQAAAQVVPPVA